MPPAIVDILKRLHTSQFQQGVIWNMVSLAMLGVCGIVMNVLIALFYDVTALGVFNQVFAAYILFSQFAAGGIHFSVLRSIAAHSDDLQMCRKIVMGALIPVIGLAVTFSVLFWIGRHPIGYILDSTAVSTGITWAAPGLFFFAVNKVLMGAINGMSWMKKFAVLQAVRPIAMILALFVAGIAGFPPQCLTVILTVAEVVVFIASLAVARGLVSWSLVGVGCWIRTHSVFGVSSFAAGVIGELNTRVDVLMLGLFASDRIVGVYSFAALLAEGVYQFLIVLQRNYNPRIARLISEGNTEALTSMVRQGKLVTYRVMVAIGVIAVVVYPLALGLLSARRELLGSWPLFAILIAGIVLCSGYIPFGGILLQAGRPATNTFLVMAVVCFNATGNALLIPLLAAQGAALATALSFVFHAFLLSYLSRRTVGLVL